MLRNYFPIYELSQLIENLRRTASVFKGARSELSQLNSEELSVLLEAIQRVCLDFGLIHTSELATRAIEKKSPRNHSEVFSLLDTLNDSLSNELKKEAVFRIPPARKDYFERDDLFGLKVATAFPSCVRDIQKAGSCYALEQEDACVHHLMLVLERGLHALAGKVGVTYQRTNWQVIINEIAAKLKSLPKGAERDFYNQVNAQFGFLTVC